ncbi:hypothetical protein BSZ36_09420 [Rubricoccus marinus]|uniref:Secretion system C-terminal sorting domain-containing protein n=2 Tax=Rubricoccus marinus TaxID=716817 RepID=A0A259TZH1_9BACT|nr:hypothetical protein BSZ36_09420 [Rubricoccus marinus]
MELREDARITPADTTNRLRFGSDLAATSRYAFFGAYGDISFPGNQRGAVYVFEREPETGALAQRQKLIPPLDRFFADYGHAVAAVEEPSETGGPVRTTLWVGSSTDDPQRPDGTYAREGGFVHAYEADADGEWTIRQTLTAPGYINDYERFGKAIAPDARGSARVLISRSGGSPLTGKGFIYERGAGELWVHAGTLTPQTLPPIDTRRQSEFGAAAGLSSDVAVVSDFLAPSDTSVFETIGAAYVFERDPATGIWSEATRLLPPPGLVIPGVRTFYGKDVAVVHAAGRPVVLVGAPFLNGGGYVFAYERDEAGVWSLAETLTSADGSGNNRFGWSLDVAEQEDGGAMVLVTSPFATVDGFSAAGAAEVLYRDARGPWRPLARLRTSRPGQFKYVGSDGAALTADGFALISCEEETVWPVAQVGAAYHYNVGALVPVETEAAPPEGAGSVLSITPNPSRGGARVTLTPEADASGGAVRVTVVDALGREVATLHAGPLAGAGSWALPASLAPGIYTVLARGQGEVQNVRVTVVK